MASPCGLDVHSGLPQAAHANMQHACAAPGRFYLAINVGSLIAGTVIVYIQVRRPCFAWRRVGCQLLMPPSVVWLLAGFCELDNWICYSWSRNGAGHRAILGREVRLLAHQHACVQCVQGALAAFDGAARCPVSRPLAATPQQCCAVCVCAAPATVMSCLPSPRWHVSSRLFGLP